MHPVQSNDFMYLIAVEARQREKAMERKRLAQSAASIHPSTSTRIRLLAVSVGNAIHRFIDPRGYAIAHMNETQPIAPPVSTPAIAARPATTAQDPLRPDILPHPDIVHSDERIAS